MWVNENREDMFDGKKVKEVMDSYSGSKIDFYTKSGLSKSTIISMMATRNPQADNLEKLADFVKAPIDYFFNRDIEIDNKFLEKKNKQSIKILVEEIKQLTKKNTLMEIEIERLKRVIEDSQFHKAD